MIILDAATEYSFLHGFGTVAQWDAACAAQGVEAFGVADYSSTWGHVPFRAFKRKVLYGVKLHVVLELERTPPNDLITLIAKNCDGLAALYRLVGVAESQSYYRPRLTWAQVAEAEGMFKIVNLASIGDYEQMRRTEGIMVAARPVQDHMRHFYGEFPVVAAYAPSFPHTNDRAAWQLAQNVSRGHAKGGFPLLNQEDYRGAMRACGVEPKGEWFDLAARIAAECEYKFPRASLVSVAGSLSSLCASGAQRLGINIERGVYADRLRREMSVIQEKHFENYFLVVGDLVAWAKERMLVGPGRGSSGGSLVCFLLGISAVDPIKSGTLFERFIDISRPDLPDIDMDFPDNRRDEVFVYLRERYGPERVARLGTISEWGPKGAINDTARQVGVPFEASRDMSKAVEGHFVGGELPVSTPLSYLFAENEVLCGYAKRFPDIRLAEQLVGHARHHGVHAAGVVVTQEPTALFGAVNKAGVLAMDMKNAESIGMVKIDVLGLRTLAVIQDCCDLLDMDPAVLQRLDAVAGDPKVWALFNNNRVTGIFQFEGKAVRQLMREIRVDKFDDLCALTSLARPGPLVGGAAATWCSRRNGVVDFDYLHPALEPYTRSTYGAIVYQEQAMQIVRDLGGFDEPMVNKFRRAVGKKDPEALRAMREQFLAGCNTWHQRTPVDDTGDYVGPHIHDKVAAAIWEEMCSFGSYAFNYSHAVAYSMLSYMSAWLKAYHPLEFAVAQLRRCDEDQTKQLLRELADEGYEYVPFDPNISQATWAVTDGKLYGGFDSVRGFGPKSAQLLLAARTAGGADWMDNLTASQRDRITSPNNTPWHSLSYFARTYAALYAAPDDYSCPSLPHGAEAPIIQIAEVPPARTRVKFLGRILQKHSKDLNAPERLARRNGRVFTEDTTFVNILIQDDSGERWATISRGLVARHQWLMDMDLEGKDFFFRADTSNDGRWLFIDTIVDLTGAENERAGQS
jgi:DNA polymerase III alpha subunit